MPGRSLQIARIETNAASREMFAGTDKPEHPAAFSCNSPTLQISFLSRIGRVRCATVDDTFLSSERMALRWLPSSLADIRIDDQNASSAPSSPRLRARLYHL